MAAADPAAGWSRDPALADLAARIAAALAAADLPAADVELERPRQPEHGDWATTVALTLAKPAKRPPRAIADALVEHLELPAAVESVEIAGPGFVNFRLAHSYLEDVVRRVLDAGEGYGRHQRDAMTRERVNAEFVSANPTGPLHVGAGRWAAAGDAIAALLEADGHDVSREYYVNDHGEQIRRFGESVLLAARGEERGEDHYRGDYIVDLAEELRSSDAGLFGRGHEAADDVASAAIALMLERIQATLARLGVTYDTWFSERSLHDGGEVEATVGELKAAGQTYEQDGALFLRTTQWGDDKDRVLIRSDGRPTYFAGDCAYLHSKLGRGFDRLIYLLGADHHGYVGRMRAAGEAVGAGADRLEIRIGQLVNLVRGGEPVKMSKRAGEFVTLDELIDEVGPDVARYHFVRTSLDTTEEFDLDVVAQASMDNPVFYVQYAHARIASLVRTADDAGFRPGAASDANFALLVHPAEIELLKRMAGFPGVIAEAADLRAPHRLARYAEELAASFHRFYNDCRVLQEDEPLARARYWLAVAARQVLANALGLLRVSAPERM